MSRRLYQTAEPAVAPCTIPIGLYSNGMVDSRTRFLETTARLLRERGYSATSMGDVVAASGAPKGSLYFHFPGGKDELVAEAIGASGAETCEAMRLALAGGGTRQGLDAIFSFLAGG